MKWISVNDNLPLHDRKVLATYENSYNNRRTIMAKYLKRWTEASYWDDVDDEYSKELDQYYLKEGWYECIENWCDYDMVVVTEGNITHWMEIPDFELVQ
jgi:hypothetical protein